MKTFLEFIQLQENEMPKNQLVKPLKKNQRFFAIITTWTNTPPLRNITPAVSQWWTLARELQRYNKGTEISNQGNEIYVKFMAKNAEQAIEKLMYCVYDNRVKNYLEKRVEIYSDYGKVFPSH